MKSPHVTVTPYAVAAKRSVLSARDFRSLVVELEAAGQVRRARGFLVTRSRRVERFLLTGRSAPMRTPAHAKKANRSE